MLITDQRVPERRLKDAPGSHYVRQLVDKESEGGRWPTHGVGLFWLGSSSYLLRTKPRVEAIRGAPCHKRHVAAGRETRASGGGQMSVTRVGTTTG